MVLKLKTLLKKYKELILYGIFGLGATLINIVTFYLFNEILELNLVLSNVLAWVCAFIFAFITNKLWVFESKDWKSRTAIKEMLEFLFARLITLFLDTFLMWLLVNVLNWNGLVAKVIVNIIVIILNYIASKLWVFRK